MAMQETPVELTKLALNIQIVSMRHDVRRARVHTINKLVRLSQKLKLKNGTEEQKEKNKKKSEKLMEEVVIIKTLKDDEISKFSLSNLRPAEKILADPSATRKQKALARLSCHGSIIACVCKFRTNFPEWERKLPEFLEELGVRREEKKQDANKQKTVKTKVKNKIVDNSCSAAAVSDDHVISYSDGSDIDEPDVQQRSAELSKPRTSELKQKSVKIKDDHLSKYRISKLEKESVKIKDKSSSDEDDQIVLSNFDDNITNKSDVQLKSESSDSSDSEVSKCRTLKQSKYNIKIKSSSGDLNAKTSRNRIAEVKKFSEILETQYSDDKNDKINNNKSEESVTPDDSLISEDPDAVTLSVDPFFVGVDGESKHFVGVQTRSEDKESNSLKEDNAYSSQQFWSKDGGKPLNRVERRRAARGLKPRSFSSRSPYQTLSTNDNWKQSPFARRKDVGIHGKVEIQNQDNAPVHPSWEAKKRMKEQQFALTAFQGKKIKFEDE